MKKLLFLLTILLISCQPEKKHSDSEAIKKELTIFLDNWHKAAANANASVYFSSMDSTSVFIGTDATENWNYKEFKDFSQPYFDRGKAWDFTAVDRNIYLNERHDFAWFDELLNTWMGICRGSGVLQLKDGKWHLKHYVLSVTVPNEDVQKLIDIKSKKDSLLLKKIIH